MPGLGPDAEIARTGNRVITEATGPEPIQAEWPALETAIYRRLGDWPGLAARDHNPRVGGSSPSSRHP
jgi:hypothetical protein